MSPDIMSLTYAPFLIIFWRPLANCWLSSEDCSTPNSRLHGTHRNMSTSVV